MHIHKNSSDMKVFEWQIDAKKFSSVAFDKSRDKTVWPKHHLNLRGLPVSDTWHIKEDGYYFDPRKSVGEFAKFLPGVPLVRGRVLRDNEMLSIFEMAGELLPVRVAEENCYLWNVTEFINAMVPENSVYQHQDSKSGEILKPCFKTTRFGVSSVFKIPESRYRAFCFSDDRPLDFFKLYNKRGYTGLTFTEMSTC